MNAKRDRIFKELSKALRQADNKGTSGYDTTAEVVRVEGETVWVHIPGGVDETPVKKTIDAVKGDTVQLRVSGGTAWIVGNETKPPTDDRVANVAKKTAENADLKAILAKKTAEDASKVATNYIDFTEEDGLTVGYKDLNSKVNISGNGVKLYDEDGNVGTEIKSGEAVFGTKGTNRLRLNSSGMSLTDFNGVSILSTGIANNAEQTTVREKLSSTTTVLQHKPDVGSQIRWQSTIRTGDTFTVTTFNFTQGVPDTEGYAGTWGRLQYDGDMTFKFVASSNAYSNIIEYTSTLTPLYITFGTRTDEETVSGNIIQYTQGKYSMTFGKELIAEHFQIVMGQANDVDESGDYAFIFGNGVINSNPSIAPMRSNAMAMDWNGNVHLKGDVYKGCNKDSSGGIKLVSASLNTGNGTESSVPSGASNLTNLAEVSLDEEGIYLLLGRVRFASNTSGRRGAAWASNSTGYFYHSLVVGAPASGGATLMQTMAIIEVASNDVPYTAYLNCYHTAGANNPLDVEYYWRYIKLA